MNLTTKERINSVWDLTRVPFYILVATTFLLLSLCFVMTPYWPLIALLSACYLIYGGAVVHYYRRGPWAYRTPYGMKVWWSNGTEPWDKNKIDARILGIIKNFHEKSGQTTVSLLEMINTVFDIQIYVKTGNIHALSNVIGRTYPGISSTFKYDYLDLALPHEINLHLCHILFPNRTEEEDVKWMVERGIE